MPLVATSWGGSRFSARWLLLILLKETRVGLQAGKVARRRTILLKFYDPVSIANMELFS
jgi:hypothetical protein